MNGQYPDYKTYRALYALYHGRGLRDLLRLLGPIWGTKAVDLCGGDGRLTSSMIRAGARFVVLVDNEPSMVPKYLWNQFEVRVEIKEVHAALSNLVDRGESFDRVVCQQAVNYWFDEEAVKRIATILKPGGVFVFNTFNQKPSKEPRVTEYKIGAHSFVEVSWLVGDVVHHLQVRDGMAPHYTSFKWISPEYFEETLKLYFEVVVEKRGKSSLYKCVK